MSEKRRPSFVAPESGTVLVEGSEEAAPSEPRSRSSQDKLKGERRLSMNSLRLRSEVETWLIDAIPKLFGKTESSELDTALQEEAQSEFINSVLFTTDPPDPTIISSKINTAFEKASQTEGYAAFADELCQKILATRSAFAQAKKQSKEVPATTVPICSDGTGAEGEGQ